MYILSVKTADYKSDPPIMIAIDCGYKDITKLLLEHKQLKINEKARSGHTPLSESHCFHFSKLPPLWLSGPTLYHVMPMAKWEHKIDIYSGNLK